MLITQKEFDQKFKNNELRIAFIGMSNIGKSYRTRELGAEKGFETYTVDAHICDAIGIPTEEEMAVWLGYPYEAQFQKHQQEYLNVEEQLTKTAPIPEGKNFALDTTGSAIYLSEDTLNFLRENFLIVHLETPERSKQEMLQKFFAQPKPLTWGDIFDQDENESTEEALRRCYPKLLEYRTKQYEELGDVHLEIFDSLNIKSHEYFWDLLRSKLPQ